MTGDRDICECGDYRHDHEGGTGACIFKGHGILDDELNRCNEFRLWKEADHE